MLLLVTLAGCGEDHHAGGVDARLDAHEYVPDAQCRANSISYAAVFADGATPMVGASLVVHDDPSRTATTDASGLFVLCAPEGIFAVDVDGDGIDGTIVEASYGQNSGLRFPSFTPARLNAVLAATSQTYDPTKGVAIVTQLGEVRLQLDAAHGTALAQGAMAMPWGLADTSEVWLFPNVTPGLATATREEDGATISFAVAPARITWVHIPHIEL